MARRCRSKLKSVTGPIFLHEAEDGVQDEQDGDDDGLGVLSEDQFQQEGDFQHPRHGRPELVQEEQEADEGALPARRWGRTDEAALVPPGWSSLLSRQRA